MEARFNSKTALDLYTSIYFLFGIFFIGKEKKLSNVELSEEAKRLRSEYQRKYQQTEKFKEYRKKWQREDRKKNPEKYKRYTANYWNRKAEAMKENKEGETDD